MKEAVSMLHQTRRLTYVAVGRLSPEQWYKIPPNFDNNIAWNIGHVLYVTGSLIYRLSGLANGLPDDFQTLYKPGSSPADWVEEPDIKQLKGLLKSQATQLAEDVDAGVFKHFQPYKTTTGFQLDTLEEAIVFNNFHEGLHLGAILAIKNCL
ncbi:MAG: DinB family protein [Ardenticatenaceae bacterium]|nr:DinB family protein [Ardenticatenaceae bacterium]